MRRKSAEDSISELTAFRRKVEAYFEECDIMEYSDQEFDAWMIARDKIDTAIGYNKDKYEEKDVDKGVLPIVSHKTLTCKELIWEEKKRCFKNAVMSVMERKKLDGDYLFEKNTQWKAVYRFAVDNGIMYEVEDPKEPKNKTTPQYAVFETFAKELQLDVNPPTRLPFTKSAINDITKPNYVRYNAPYPWSQEGLFLEDQRSITLYIALDEVYLALQEEYEKSRQLSDKNNE
jgi:hypothetical protein